MGSANDNSFFVVVLSTVSSDVGVGKSYCMTPGAIVTGLVPAGNGADCTVPAPVVSLTALSQYQRAPSGDVVHEFTPVATVTRLASLPSVCIFRTSAPVADTRADQDRKSTRLNSSHL